MSRLSVTIARLVGSRAALDFKCIRGNDSGFFGICHILTEPAGAFVNTSIKQRLAVRWPSGVPRSPGGNNARAAINAALHDPRFPAVVR